MSYPTYVISLLAVAAAVTGPKLAAIRPHVEEGENQKIPY